MLDSRRRTLLVFFFSSLVVFGSLAGYAVLLFRQVPPPDHPRIEYPAQVDLGSRLIGDQVTHHFEIANTVVRFPASLVGTELSESFEVWETALSPRPIHSATSSDPRRVEVKVLPAEPEDGERQGIAEERFAGRVQVRVVTSSPGEVDAAVEVFLGGDSLSAERVQVIGRVVAAVELSPPSLTLPRNSSAGPVYTANCLCRSTQGADLRLEVDDAPKGLTVEVIPNESTSTRVIRVTWDPSADNASQERCRIRFKASTNGRVDFIDLPLRLVN